MPNYEGALPLSPHLAGWHVVVRGAQVERPNKRMNLTKAGASDEASQLNPVFGGHAVERWRRALPTDSDCGGTAIR